MENRGKIEQKLREYVFGLKDADGTILKEGLLDIRKKTHFTELIEYQRLKDRITTFIWKYAEVRFSAEKILDSGEGIMEFAGIFITKYEPDSKKGDMFAYIYKGLKQKISKEENEKKKEEKRQGIRISENKTDESPDRRYARLVKICNANDKDIHAENVVEWLAGQIYIKGATPKNIAKIKELIETHSFGFAKNEQKNADGESFSIFDTMTDDSLYVKNENHQAGEEKLKKLLEPVLEKIEDQYKTTHAQPKKDGFLSALLTLRLLKKIGKLKSLRSFICELISSYGFSDQAILEKWKNGEKLQTDEEIALRKGRDKTQASRVLRPFKMIFDGLKN